MLSNDQRRVLADLFEEARQRALERNRIVHGIWGVSSSLPDALVWADTKDVLKHEGESLLATEETMLPDEWTMTFPARWRLSKETNTRVRYLAYSEADFIEVSQRIKSFAIRLSGFMVNLAGGLFQP